jgi:hypothetical protein
MQRNQGTWAEYSQTTTLRCGNIKVTIWQNVSENRPFFATTFSRPFKDQTGAWRNGTSFGLNDLEALMNVAFEAKESLYRPFSHRMPRADLSHGRAAHRGGGPASLRAGRRAYGMVES